MHKVPLPLSLPPEHETLAEQEAASYNNASLEQDAKQREHVRREGFRDHVHIAGKLVFWLIVAVAVAIVALWVWHIATPRTWHFLEDHQLSEIKSLIFSGTVVTVASTFLKRYF